jgi:hypothetical protein
MSNIMTPDNILAALENMESELPSLTGQEAWATIKDDFHTLKLKLKDSNDHEERDRLASELVDFLIPYEHARDRLKEEIHLPNIQAILRDTMETDLVEFVSKMDLDNNVVEPSAAVVLKSIVVDSEESKVRLIKIKEGGIEPGKSMKLSNFHIDLLSMIELIGPSILTTTLTAADPVVAGVLLIIGNLTKIPKMITNELSEKETSVFWGFILARDADNLAKESLIAEHTNHVRKKNGRLPLTNEGVRDALRMLEKLKSVELVEGKQDTWRIVEKYKIK